MYKNIVIVNLYIQREERKIVALVSKCFGLVHTRSKGQILPPPYDLISTPMEGNGARWRKGKVKATAFKRPNWSNLKSDLFF